MTENAKPNNNYNLILLAGIILLAALTRLIAYPYTLMWESDALARTWITMDWLKDPYIIPSGVWGPGHTYFSALTSEIAGDAFIGPIIFGCILSLATAIPLYLITVKLFGDAKAGLFVAAVYAFYPIAIRSGYVNMPESPSIFFLVMAFYFLVRAKAEDGRLSDAIIAGIFMTLTASMRFEIWLYIPLLGLMLYNKYRYIIAFWAFAMIFPLYWMASSYEDQGDILYSMNQSREWELVIEASEEDMDTSEIIKRIFFYPVTSVLGPTPLIALMIFGGAAYAVYRRQPQSIWLIAPVILVALIMVNTLNASLETKSRYTLAYMIFLFPFMAIPFQELMKKQWGTAAAVGLVVTIIPLSYLGNFGTPTIIRKLYEGDINAFPTLVDTDTDAIKSLSETVNDEIDDDAIVLSDFFGWATTYNVLYNTKLGPERVFVAPGGKNEPVDVTQAERVLSNGSEGVILLQEETPFAEIIGYEAGDEEVEFQGYTFELEFIDTFEIRDMTIEVYRFKSSTEAS